MRVLGELYVGSEKIQKLETNQNQNEGVKYMRQAAEKGEDLAKEFLKINNLS